MKKNILANILGKFWSILSNFLFIPIYINYLGFESYSVISFSLMLMGIMVILDAGLTASLSREFARSDKSPEHKKSMYKTLESVFAIIVCVCTLLIFLNSNFIVDNLIKSQKYPKEQLEFFVKVISFDVGFQLLFRFYLGGLLGINKQILGNIIQIGWGVFRNGIVVLVLVFYPTLDSFFIWQSISTIVFCIIIKIFLDINVYKGSINYKFEIKKNNLTEIKTFIGGMMLISIISTINTQLDKLTISKLLSIESLGFYTIAISVAQIFIIIVNPISTAILPRITDYASSGKKDDINVLYNRIMLLLFIVLSAIFSIVFFFGKTILYVWTGDFNIVDNTSKILPIVVFAYIMLAIAIIPYCIAIAYGVTKYNNIIGLISTIVIIPSYYFGVKNMGMLGAAITFLCIQVLTTIIFISVIERKFLNNKFLFYLRSFIIPLLSSLLLAYIIFSFLGNELHSRIIGALELLTSLSIVMCIMILIFLNKEIRGYLLLIKKRFSSFSDKS